MSYPHETKITWRNRRVIIRYDPNHFDHTAHIEIQAEDKRPLPITETGYKSHFFIHDGTYPAFGEIQQEALNLLEKDASSDAWQAYEIKTNQLDLFL